MEKIAGMTLLSAHRGGPGLGQKHMGNTLGAISAATELDVEFVGLDIQRCADGIFVLSHDNAVLDGSELRDIEELSYKEVSRIAPLIPTYEQALRTLAGKKKAHLDFKFVTPESLVSSPELTPEVEATKIAIDIMGAENVIVTTMEDVSVYVVRQWSKPRYPDLLVGLSLRKGVSDMSLMERIKRKRSEAFLAERLESCDANLLVFNYDIGRHRLAKWATERGFPTLICVVDDIDSMDDWLRREDVWMVTTNFPEEAIILRE